MSDLVKAGDTPRGDQPRRIWSADEKRRIVAASFQPNASVAAVARRHGVNANLLFTWRRRLGRAGSVRRQEPVEIMPVAIATENAPAAVATPLASGGRIEIVLSSGEGVIVGADVEAAALARFIKVLAVMIPIIPIEEAAAERLRVFDAAEPLRKLRLVFQGFEMAFRERIVVRRVGGAMRFGDAEIGQQQGCSFGLHRAAAISMQGELAWRDIVPTGA